MQRLSGGLGRLHRGCRRLSGGLGSLLEVMGKLPGECGEVVWRDRGAA